MISLKQYPAEKSACIHCMFTYSFRIECCGDFVGGISSVWRTESIWRHWQYLGTSSLHGTEGGGRVAPFVTPTTTDLLQVQPYLTIVSTALYLWLNATVVCSFSFSGLISWKGKWINWWFESNHRIIWHQLLCYNWLTYTFMALFVYPRYTRVYLDFDWLIYFLVLIEWYKLA